MAKPSRQTVAAAIANLISAGADTSELAKGLAAYLITERRTAELEPLLRDVMRVRFDRDGLLEIDATSAFPLTEAIRSEIDRLLPAKSRVLHENIAPEVIGGLRLEALDRQLDATLSRRLANFKQAGATSNV